MKTNNEMTATAMRAGEGGSPARIAAPEPIPFWMENVLGKSLTAVAGYVDAIGYLALGGLFASFMSGSSILLGVSISDGLWSTAYDAALLISAFVAGAIVTTVLAGLAGIWALAIVLTLEGGLLVGATLLVSNGWEVSRAIIAVVAAMGVQNMALRPRNGVRLGATS